MKGRGWFELMDVVFALIGVVVVAASVFSAYASMRALRVQAGMARSAARMIEVLERRG